MLAKALAKYTYEYVDVSKLFGMAIHSKEGKFVLRKTVY